jgi:hypothetical protein
MEERVVGFVREGMVDQIMSEDVAQVVRMLVKSGSGLSHSTLAGMP